MRVRWLVAAAAVFATFFVFVIVSGLAVGGGVIIDLMSRPAGAATCQTAPDVGGVAPVGKLDGDQAKNAATIIAVGRTMGVPERGWVIAIAVALQESRLHNVHHGDAAGPDSTGLFQQRGPWGPRAVRDDPAGASRLFYDHLLAPTDWRGQPKPPWQTQPLTQAAQAVQGSAFPSAYAKHEATAQQAVHDLAGVTVAASICQQAAPVDGWMLPLPAGKVHAPTAEHHDYPAVDLPLLSGETLPVFSMTAGVAAPMEEPAGCGHGVYVRGTTGEWLYCHLSQQLVRDGQQVRPGDQLGVSGWSGGVDPPGPAGAHLHVQLRRGGKLTCVQPVLDALKAGQPPPALDLLPQPPANTCLKAWANH